MTGDGEDGEKLSLFDACSMAVGGMVGGGIFAVLGEAADMAGNAAYLSFAAAGVLALLTGLSYARLTVRYDEPGGSFSYVERMAGPRVAGTLSWYLLLGYVFTVSLYSFTFGAYSARLLGLSGPWQTWLGAGIVVALTGLNLMGVRESGLAEDVLVTGKVLILAVVAGAGFLAVEPSEALPVFETGIDGALLGAALIFVAYEGFQLLTYDYDEIEDHERNLPRAIWISIPVVIFIYVVVAGVTTGSLSDAAIARHHETVLAVVARPVLGRAGLVAVLVAAVFSTASAINATIFASARLARRVAADDQLPDRLVRSTRGGVPVGYALLSAAVAIAVQTAGSLHQITSFSSLVFLSVFAVVNVSAWREGVFGGWKRALPPLASGGCLTAAGLLARDLYRSDPSSLWLVAGIVGGVGLLRFLFQNLSSDFLQRLEERAGTRRKSGE